jgi:hypothetical protein
VNWQKIHDYFEIAGDFFISGILIVILPLSFGVGINQTFHLCKIINRNIFVKDRQLSQFSKKFRSFQFIDFMTEIVI